MNFIVSRLTSPYIAYIKVFPVDTKKTNKKTKTNKKKTNKKKQKQKNFVSYITVVILGIYFNSRTWRLWHEWFAVFEYCTKHPPPLLVCLFNCRKIALSVTWLTPLPPCVLYHCLNESLANHPWVMFCNYLKLNI